MGFVLSGSMFMNILSVTDPQKLHNSVLFFFFFTVPPIKLLQSNALKISWLKWLVIADAALIRCHTFIANMITLHLRLTLVNGANRSQDKA